MEIDNQNRKLTTDAEEQRETRLRMENANQSQRLATEQQEARIIVESAKLSARWRSKDR